MKNVTVVSDEGNIFELRRYKMVEVPDSESKKLWRRMTIEAGKMRKKSFYAGNYMVRRSEIERCLRLGLDEFLGFTGKDDIVGCDYSFDSGNRLHTSVRWKLILGCCWFEEKDARRILAWARRLPKNERLTREGKKLR